MSDQSADPATNDPAVEKYIRSGGVICPNCGSDDIQGEGPFDVDIDGAYQDVSCKKCGATWTDHYKLVAVLHLDIPGQSEAT